MIDNDMIKAILPMSIHDGSICDVRWDGSNLYFNIVLCDNDDGTENKITLHFSGVEWIRSLCDENHDGYIAGTSFCEYPSIDRCALNLDYKEFVAYGLLDDITVSDGGVVFVNDIFFLMLLR